MLSFNGASTTCAYLEPLLQRMLEEFKHFWRQSLQYESPQGSMRGYLPLPNCEKGSRQQGQATSILFYN